MQINHNRSTALEPSIINYWGLKPVSCCSSPRPRFCCGSQTYKLFGSRARLLLINESKQQHINQDSTLRWNKMRTQQQDQYWNTGATEVQQLNPDGVRVLEDGSSGICQLHRASEVWLIIETLFCSRYGRAFFGSGMFHARQDGIKKIWRRFNPNASKVIK